MQQAQQVLVLLDAKILATLQSWTLRIMVQRFTRHFGDRTRYGDRALRRVGGAEDESL